MYEQLKGEGFDVWVDFDRILPGQDWNYEITRALNRTRIVLAFVSQSSVERRSYLQRELRLALEKRQEMLSGDIYLVPVMLDDETPVPEELKTIQAIRMSDPRFHKRLADALTYQLGRLGVELAKVQREAGVSWSISRTNEAWEGLPGYRVGLEFVDVHSDKGSNLSEIGVFIRGRLVAHLFRHRAGKLNQAPQVFNYVQESYRRTNTFDAHCDQPVLRGCVLTIPYSMSWYGAGAAHPNYYIETYSFILDPLHLVAALPDLFTNPDAALSAIQSHVREDLSRSQRRAGREEADSYTLDPTSIESGTSGWEDFAAVVFGPDGLEFSFAPYQVGPFAYGFHHAKVPYQKVATLVRPAYRTALDIDRYSVR